jgi:hypothetical protein
VASGPIYISLMCWPPAILSSELPSIEEVRSVSGDSSQEFSIVGSIEICITMMLLFISTLPFLYTVH